MKALKQIVFISQLLSVVVGEINAQGLPSFYVDVITGNGATYVTYCAATSATLVAKNTSDGTQASNVLYWEEGDLTFNANGSENFIVTHTYNTTSSTLSVSLGTGAKSYRAVIYVSSTLIKSRSFTIYNNAPVTAGTLTGTANYMNSGSGTLTYTGGFGAVQWMQKTPQDADWVNIAPPSGGSYNLTQTTQFKVRRYDISGTCADAMTPPVTVEVYKTGMVQGPPSTREGTRVSLSLFDFYKDVIRWEVSNDGGSTWTYLNVASAGLRYEVVANTKFRALVNLGPFGTGYSSTLDVTYTPYTQSDHPLVNGNNYVREQTVTVSNVTNPASVNALPATQKHEAITYLDGHGRTVQQNLRGASPMQKDIVTFADYDHLGRQAKQYKPYVSGTNDGLYKSDPFTEQLSFYTSPVEDKIANSNYPFAVSVFESSPLGRLTEQGSLGNAWQPGSGHTKVVGHTNNASGDVRLFNSDGSSSGYYSPNDLDLTTGKDEDGKNTQVFTDKEGRTILSRTQLDESVNSVLVPWLETYYIYNPNNTIRYIISPKGVAALKTGSWAWTASITNQYVHQLVYDVRGRLVQKKVPGQDWMYYCYDRLDRLVLAQDGIMRLQNNWIFFKYDKKGRVVRQGLYTDAVHTTLSGMQAVIDPLYVNDTDIYFEDDATTNNCFPTSGTADHVTNRYDSYIQSYTPQGLPNEGTPGSAVGLLTSSSKLILGTSTWVSIHYFYDAKGRLIQQLSNNHLSQTLNNLTTNVYDFEGKLLTSKTYHDAGSSRTVTTTNSAQYDAAGRTTVVLSSSGEPINQQSQQPFTSTMTGQSVQWTNLTGVIQTGNTLKKTGTNNGWDSGAFSAQSMPAGTEGWIEFSAGETNTHKMMGLSATDGSASYNTINYAFYPSADGILYVYENGSGISLSAPYATTDILRVERVGTNIVYKKNGVILYTSPITSNGMLYADCSIYSSNASFTNISLGVGHSNNVNVTLNGNTLVKTAGTDGVSWDAGAFSTQSIPANRDGWIEFSAGEGNTYKMMGLSSTDGGVGYGTINYALYPEANGNLYAYENGTRTPTAALSTYLTTDVLRVERVGTTIYYKKNGAVLYTSTIPSTGVLFGDCSFYNRNASFKNISMVVSPWSGAPTITTTNGKLQKTSGVTGTWDGATSYRSIPANTNGYLEFSAGETNTEKAFGLKSSTIVYAIYTTNTGKVQVLENGSAKSALVSYASTDVFRIERTGSAIVYKQNGTVIYTSTSPASGVLNANCGISTVGGSIGNISMGVTNIQVASYQYNELGELVDKKLHSTDGTNFLQSVDYRYSIKGQLASINNANLDVNNANNDETNDYFGMELLYEAVDNNLGTTPCYNGNISTIKWKGVGTPSGYDAIRSYRYIYDNANRLKTGVSQIYSSAANSWVKETGALNETMTYDLNGNIQTLQRNQRKNQSLYTYVSETVDNLTYAYNPSMGDQLLTVTDATSKASGFDNGSSGNNTDYTYDANGSLTSDQNKGISNIVYNHLSKPTSIVYTDGRHVDYTYDAAGTKLTVKAYAIGGTSQTTTDYVGSFVYVNNVLSFYGSPEGRVVNNNGNLEYQYSIADNQGNTRVVFTSVNPTTAPVTATFEDAVADSKIFQNVNTSSMYWVSKSGANNTNGGQYVMRMNYTYPTGPAKSLTVFPGDVVAPEVYAYYEGSSGFGGSNESVAALITSVASAFGGVSGGTGKDGLIYNGVNSAYTAFGSPVNAGDGAPTAHLNYILFDKDYNLLDMGWQSVPATANMAKQKISFGTPITIKEAGYMYVYLSYEGGGTNWVYFDDLKITHTKTNVIQYNEYYPFGLQASTSWTRDNVTNNFLYNEASEINTTTGWYDLPFRNYDATLGRFVQVDPLATQNGSYSSYHYGFNNPVLFNDPSGADPDDPKTMSGPNNVPNPYPDGFDPDYDKIFPNNNAPTSGNTIENIYNEAMAGSFFPGNGASGYERWVYEEGTRHADGTRDVDKTTYFWLPIKRDQTQGSASVILNFSNESYLLRPGSSWLYRSVCDMDEANAYLQLLASAGKTIRNLVIVGHANVEHVSLGENGAGYTASNVDRVNPTITTPETLAKFNKMIANVASGGNVLMVTCNADTYFGKALQSNIRCDINIFMNSGLCNLPRYPSDTGISFGGNIVKGGEYRNITQDPNGISLYKNISLNINGTLNIK